MMSAPVTLLRLRTAGRLAALALAVLVFVGCSADRHTYRSTPTAPKSIAITYVQSGETAWAYDIPIGQQLTLEFKRAGQFNGFVAPKTPATSMNWYVSGLDENSNSTGHPGRYGADKSGEVAFNGQPNQINVSIRKPGEDELEDGLDAVPAPPALDVEEVPAPAEVEAPEVPEAPEAAEDVMQAEEAVDTVEEAAADAVEAAEDAVEEAADAVEDAADDAMESMDK